VTLASARAREKEREGEKESAGRAAWVRRGRARVGVAGTVAGSLTAASLPQRLKVTALPRELHDPGDTDGIADQSETVRFGHVAATNCTRTKINEAVSN